jgi:tRNA U34 5-carboxymethylaminomethyl modifying enzyme MnmG/GidA
MALEVATDVEAQGGRVLWGRSLPYEEQTPYRGVAQIVRVAAGIYENDPVQVARQKRLEHKKIPESFDYRNIQHLRFEAREKLTRIRPITLAQAGRISGITPADMALVLAHLEGK